MSGCDINFYAKDGLESGLAYDFSKNSNYIPIGAGVGARGHCRELCDDE
jgi:hypothetical protein